MLNLVAGRLRQIKNSKLVSNIILSCLYTSNIVHCEILAWINLKLSKVGYREIFVCLCVVYTYFFILFVYYFPFYIIKKINLSNNVILLSVFHVMLFLFYIVSYIILCCGVCVFMLKLSSTGPGEWLVWNTYSTAHTRPALDRSQTICRHSNDRFE